MSARHFLACASLLMGLLLGPVAPGQYAAAGADAAKRAPHEYLVKAAFLYRLAQFVVWPAASTGELRFCVIGLDPFRGALDSIEGRAVNDRRVVIARPKNTRDAESCDIMFVSASEAGRVEAILAAFAREAVLTVSDMSGFGQAGGIIGLKTEANRLRFEVNTTAARTAGLALEPQALELAEIIEPEGVARHEAR